MMYVFRHDLDRDLDVLINSFLGHLKLHDANKIETFSKCRINQAYLDSHRIASNLSNCDYSSKCGFKMALSLLFLIQIQDAL